MTSRKRTVLVLVRSLAVAVLLPLVLSLTGCGGDGGGAAGGRVQTTGVVRLALTDAAGPYENVVITLEAIRLVPAGREGEATGPGLPLLAAFDPPVQYDIADLAFAQEVLGQATVAAGAYNQVRLVLAANPATGDPLNYLTLKSDPFTKLPLHTPSGQQSGLKVVGHYDVEPGVINAIALDFDPERAVVQAGASGRYNLKPTGIRIVELDAVLPTYASLSGTVAPEAAWPTAVVHVIPEGGITAIASGSVNPDDGSFRAFVPGGTYALRVTATGFAPYDTRSLVPPVYYVATVGSDTPVGTITLSP